MKIVVLIAGVEDPKWPITPEAALAGAGEHRIMSPFDEAALEIALRVRDADPATSIAARVVGGAASEKIARAIAALRVDDLATVAIEQQWDQAATARALAPLCEGADLVLIGREFGDFDDGLVPAMLAGLLVRPFFGRAQMVETGTGVHLARETSAFNEILRLSGPLVASVTNDRRTRLRKPLMKNVMLARQAEISAIGSAASDGDGLSLERIVPSSGIRNGTECAMIAGTVQAQAHVLSDILWQARA